MSKGLHPTSARNALAWFGEDAACREIALQAERMVALQSALVKLSPIGGLVALGLDAEGTLKVGTASAASAAKLRQLEPRLVAGLSAEGWPVSRIRFRPRPRGDQPPPPVSLPREPIPPAALAAFGALEREAQGTLKEALQRLLRRAR